MVRKVKRNLNGHLKRNSGCHFKLKKHLESAYALTSSPHPTRGQQGLIRAIVRLD